MSQINFKPSSLPARGEFFYDTTTLTFKIFDGLNWITTTTSPGRKKPTLEELAEMYPAVKEAKDQLDFIVTMVTDYETT